MPRLHELPPGPRAMLRGTTALMLALALSACALGGPGPQQEAPGERDAWGFQDRNGRPYFTFPDNPHFM